ncbi:uncharacterized protein LOC115883481 [Sitophilus oryzae]|uniref:Uncharacterized protein LOC115883481 n=1 Tax=Sitophilus oryzae TaxID=7048 RepID=A0A6J2Y441_SITOR|nr:uncharacterized protein LOC115883481 [Sitophilus oryzae]
MTTIPCTLLIQSKDKFNFPTKMLFVVTKQLFSYGIKDISIKKNMVFVALTYTPKNTTLQKKIGNLPVRYARLKIDDEMELKMLEKAWHDYKFNLTDEEEPSNAVIANEKNIISMLCDRFAMLYLSPSSPTPPPQTSTSRQEISESEMTYIGDKNNSEDHHSSNSKKKRKHDGGDIKKNKKMAQFVDPIFIIEGEEGSYEGGGGGNSQESQRFF